MQTRRSSFLVRLATLAALAALAVPFGLAHASASQTPDAPLEQGDATSPPVDDAEPLGEIPSCGTVQSSLCEVRECQKYSTCKRGLTKVTYNNGCLQGCMSFREGDPGEKEPVAP